MSRNIGRLFDPWRFVAVGDDPEKMAPSINRSMASLERLIESMRLALLYGPVGGAYLPFNFSTTTLAAAATNAAFLLPCDCRPLAASAWVNNAASQLTIDILSGGTSIFPGTWQFTGQASKNTRAAFSTDTLTAGALLALSVVSVGDGGTAVPTKITVGLWTKNASKIEPA